MKIEVTGPKKAKLMNVFRVIYQKQCFTGPRFLKTAPEYIDPSGHFVSNEIFCSSILLVELHLSGFRAVFPGSVIGF